MTTPRDALRTQPAHHQIEDAPSFADAFDSSVGKVRIVVLVSPTCAVCLDGVRLVVDTLLADGKRDRAIALLVVWVPVLDDDDHAAAESAASLVPHQLSARQFYDDSRVVSGQVHAALALDRFERTVAWDLYLLYDRSATWAPRAPSPRVWMHQLRIDAIPSLDQPQLSAQISALLLT